MGGWEDGEIPELNCLPDFKGQACKKKLCRVPGGCLLLPCMGIVE